MACSPSQEQLHIGTLGLLIVGGDQEDGLEARRMGFDERPDHALSDPHQRLMLRDAPRARVLEQEPAGGRPALDVDCRELGPGFAHVPFDSALHRNRPLRIDGLGLERCVSSQAVVHHGGELDVDDLFELIRIEAAGVRAGEAQDEVPLFVREHEVALVLRDCKLRPDGDSQD